jgi:hypothetical protein
MFKLFDYIFGKIELSGNLKGRAIKENFNDLDSYQLYLENNSCSNQALALLNKLGKFSQLQKKPAITCGT